MKQHLTHEMSLTLRGKWRTETFWKKNCTNLQRIQMGFIDQCIFWWERAVKLRSLTPLQLFKSLGELAQTHLSSRDPESECCWETSQGATLINNIITDHKHIDTRRHPRLLQDSFSSILAAALRPHNEIFKATNFSHETRVFFFFFISLYKQARRYCFVSY